MKLIPEWRHSWRFSSNWFHAAQVAIIAAWASVPGDLRASVPTWAMIALSGAIFALGLVARVVAQPSVPKSSLATPHD